MPSDAGGPSGADALRVLAERAPVGMLHTDVDGTIRWVNDRWREITGCQLPTPFAYDHLHELVVPDDRDRILELYATAAAEHRPFSTETDIRRDGDGEVRHLRLAAEPLLDDDGAPVGFVGTVTDLTDLAAAQEAARRRELRYRLVLDSLHEAVLVHSEDRLETANAAAEQIMGRSAEELGELSTYDETAPVHPDGRPMSLAERPSLVAMREQRPVRDVLMGFLHPTRGRRWVLANATPIDEGGRTTGAVLSFSDVTDRKRAEDALRASEERYRRLVEHAPVAYVVADEWGRVAEANHHAARLFGASTGDLFGRSLLEWVHPDDRPRLDGLVGQLLGGDVDRYEVEHRIVLDDGTERWVSVATTLTDGSLDGGRSFLALLQDVTERRRPEAQLAHRATHDDLTGLPNRALLLEHLERALAAAGADRPLALLFLDLDHFKSVNDSMGHEAGDELLREVARRVAAVVRPDDLVARLGGDEFVVLCEGVVDEHQAADVAHRIAEAVEARPIRVGTTELTTTASVGIALSSGTGHPEALLRDADAAMYRAKELGRARLEVYDEAMRARAADRNALADELARALEGDELVLHHQPTVDLATGEVRGVEALVRWQHPERGLLAPGAFIELAEDTGLIVGLGLRVLTLAAQAARRWHEELGEAAPPVHVNLSAAQVAAPSMGTLVRGVLSATGLPPTGLCLEVTESVLMEDAAAAEANLRELHDAGVRVAVDDFGTGYSSLSYLRRFPVDVLKIDRSFVEALGPDPEAAAIVRAIIGLARTLGLESVAEGIETPEQVRHLQELGCDSGQGFWFARPVAEDELADVLRRRFDVVAP